MDYSFMARQPTPRFPCFPEDRLAAAYAWCASISLPPLAKIVLTEWILGIHGTGWRPKVTLKNRSLAAWEDPTGTVIPSKHFDPNADDTLVTVTSSLETCLIT